MISDLKNFKWRRRNSWQFVFQSFNTKEKLALWGLAAIVVLSSLGWFVFFVLNNTEVKPKVGGEYAEGIIGEPLYINPVLSLTNEVDSVIEYLIFSRLFTYDNEGNLKPDLIDRYEISEDRKTYILFLKQNLTWQDGEKITANDIEYTFNTIQNPDFKSPLSLNLRGVEIQKVDEYQVKFTTKNVYTPFLNNLTFGILPQHILKDASASNFPLAEFNLKPIGNGPYKFSKLKKDRDGHILSYTLEQNSNYHGNKPYIEKIVFKFYQNEESLIDAFNKKEIHGIHSISPSSKDKLQNAEFHSIKLPRYYAVFLNQTKSKALADMNIRKALALATDKEKISKEIFSGEAAIVHNPILEGMNGYNPGIKVYNFSLDEAKKMLDEKGWKDIDNDNVREKDNVRAEFTVVTSDLPEFLKTAEILKNSWQEIGIKANILPLNVGDLQQNYIKPREYEAILFGEILSLNPDPYSFWHSSEKKDPGLNLAMYDNRDVDKALEQARQVSDTERASHYQVFQSIIAEEVPAIFLYSPNYIHPCNQQVKDFDVKIIASPPYLFSNITEWYTETKRVWKK